MKVFQNTETLPVLLMSYLQSREQKWYRSSIVSLLTSRRTEIATSAWGPRLQGLLAEQAHWHSRERTISWFSNCGSKSSQWRMWISKQLSIRCGQDLATQWLQSYPCKTKTSQETKKSVQKFLEPTRKTKDTNTENSTEFGKSCEDFSWNHCTSTPHRSETDGIAEREQCAESRKGHLRYCCNQVWRKKKVGGFHGMLLLFAKHTRSLVWWEDKTLEERRFGEPCKGPIMPFRAQFLLKTCRDCISSASKSYQV